MKTSKLFLSTIIMCLIFVSCKQETEVVYLPVAPIIEYKTPDSVKVITVIDFENVKLNSDSIWNGSDGSGSFTTKVATLNNSYNSTYFSWSGFACSAKKDTKTAGWGNQYSVSAGSGAVGSKQFALTYGTATLLCDSNSYGNFSIKSAMITNSTYAYLEIKNGGYGKIFAAGDWFKVTITGYLNGIKTNTTDYYLADFRDGKSFISNSWNKVDLASLGKVDKVTFTLSSTDNNDYGMKTPAYCCIDNIEFTQTFPTN